MSRAPAAVIRPVRRPVSGSTSGVAGGEPTSGSTSLNGVRVGGGAIVAPAVDPPGMATDAGVAAMVAGAAGLLMVAVAGGATTVRDCVDAATAEVGSAGAGVVTATVPVAGAADGCDGATGATAVDVAMAVTATRSVGATVAVEPDTDV
jgi:hypothetical protein